MIKIKKRHHRKISTLDKIKSENDKQIGGLNSKIKSLLGKINDFELKKQKLLDDLILKENESLKTLKQYKMKKPKKLAT